MVFYVYTITYLKLFMVIWGLVYYCFTMFYSHTRYLWELQQTSMMCSVALCPLHESFFFRSAVLEGNHPVPEATNGAGARHLQVGLGA
jgi:hypothetical protein